LPYSLGVDVGTTFTAAALFRGGHVEIIALASHQTVAPTAVFVDGDQLAFGAAALRRGQAEPSGLAIEFKRRVGDPVPLILSGSPYHAARLVALFAQWVVTTVSEQLGEPPQAIVMTHPANWTQFQVNQLQQALDEVGLTSVVFLTEPEAAALDFAAAGNVEVGDLHVVYDLGGGTFDVALLRRDEKGFSQVGDATGLDRLGGIDFDESVFQFVWAQLPPEVIDWVRTDSEGRRAMSHLRRACIDAKEGLSSEVAVDIPVLLPQLSTTVRLTRSEFESMIRPPLQQTVELVRRMLEQSGVDPSQLAGILLVGGSSRIPLVSDMVASELGVQARVDAHPKLVVCRGAARWSASAPQRRAAVTFGSTEDGEGRGRRPLVVGAIAAAVALVGVAVGALLVTRSDGESGEAPETSTLGTSATSTAETSDRQVTSPSPVTTATSGPTPTTALVPTITFGQPIAVPPFPDSFAFDGQSLWLTLTSVGQVARLDPTSGQTLGTIDVGPDPVDIAFGEGALWVTARVQNAVLRLDPATNQFVAIDLGRPPVNIAVGAGAVWVTMADEGLFRIDPATNTPVEVGLEIPRPGGLFVADETVWVAQRQDNVVVRVNTTSLAFDGEPIPVGIGPDPVAVADGVLWVGNRGADTVSRVDLATGEKVDQPVAGEPADVAVDGRRIWIVCATSGTLELLDAVDAGPLDSHTLEGRPLTVFPLADSLWLALGSANQIVRAGLS
jgi:actin-like ATPase involved in cell morphogenesis/streptogramin lyase